MKTFFLKLILLGLIIMLPIWLFGQFDNIDRSYSNNLNIAKFREIKQLGPLDYLIVGNSYAYSSVDPRRLARLGKQAYNLGVAAAGVDSYEIIIDDYLKLAPQRPKNLLILISPMTFSSMSDNFESYPIHRYLNQPLPNEYLLVKFNLPEIYIKLLKKSSAKGFKHLLLRSNASAGDKEIRYQGFIPNNDVYNDGVYRKEKYMYEGFKKDVFPFNKARYLLGLAKQYEKAGLPVVFYEPPTFKLNEFFSRQYLSDYEKTVKMIQGEKFTVIRYPDQLGAKYFRNIDHMNSKGAKIFTDYLIKQLGLY